jgi:hypothetical protein
VLCACSEGTTSFSLVLEHFVANSEFPSFRSSFAGRFSLYVKNMLKSMHVVIVVCPITHIIALPIHHSSVSKGRPQGSRLHRPSASSNTSAVFELSPPTTMTHPPMAALAKYLRASCIGGSGSHRSMYPPRVSTSHDAVGARLLSLPPKIAKRPFLLATKRCALLVGRFLPSHSRFKA